MWELLGNMGYVCQHKSFSGGLYSIPYPALTTPLISSLTTLPWLLHSSYPGLLAALHTCQALACLCNVKCFRAFAPAVLLCGISFCHIYPPGSLYFFQVSTQMSPRPFPTHLYIRTTQQDTPYISFTLIFLQSTYYYLV